MIRATLTRFLASNLLAVHSRCFLPQTPQVVGKSPLIKSVGLLKRVTGQSKVNTTNTASTLAAPSNLHLVNGYLGNEFGRSPSADGISDATRATATATASPRVLLSSPTATTATSQPCNSGGRCRCWNLSCDCSCFPRPW